ncbi:MAG TPA: TonB-dependent receptor [Sphingomonas sp.]|nr:TonB-dependent receptor [Sphingomonas sp.]
MRCGASLLVLSGAVAAVPVWAQDAPAAQSDDQDNSSSAGNEIVVTGIRASLANAQEIKRNSDTIVDAITASDIGALPDRSVTEALQRVPGVAINRFAGSNDPDHFSVEGSGVVVRGLSFVRSEFNGRDTFSTGVYGQAINFSDVPSELLGSVEVYKNTTAEMIEGGLSGTVNLNTRKPFDQDGFLFSFDVEANYGDMAKKFSPTVSALVSNTWDTGIGRIGFLADVAYSQLYTRADGIQVTNFQTRDNSITTAANSTSTGICRNPLPSDSDDMTLPPVWDSAAGTPPCGTAGTAGADGMADYSALQYAPLGGQFRTQDFDRQRTGIAVAGQWESLDRRALLTAQFLRTDAYQRWGEHTFESAPDLAEYNTYPAGCLPNGNGPGNAPGAGGTTRAECPVGGFENYQYDENGVFESGYITLPGSGWRTADSSQPTTNVPTGGMQQSLSRREVEDENVVEDYGLNFKFTPNDRWSFNVDAQYVHAEHDTLDMSVFGSTFADEELDLTGDIPVVIPHKPVNYAAGWGTPNPDMAAASDDEFFRNPNFSFWRAAMDHIEHSVGNEWAFREDTQYNFDDGSFLKHVKVGARYADRDQKIRNSAYNWGAISEVWSGSAVSFAQSPEYSGFYTFDNFFRGQTSAPPGGYYFNGNLIEAYPGSAEYFKSINDIWHNENGATATNRWVPASQRAGVIPGTDFLPSEIQTVSERNLNAYLMLSFGNDDYADGGLKLSGNVGVRYVDTKLRSNGAFAIPTATNLGATDPFDVRCAIKPPPTNAPPGTPPSMPGGICNLGEAAYAELQQFAGDGSSQPVSATNTYHYFLPSLNLKLSATNNLIFRFAASRALARPSLADTRNYFQASFDGNTYQLQLTRGNPYLKPAISDQFDVTAEWYFARVGSLTFDGFYKEIKNFFYQAVTPVTLTNNGITETFQARGPANFDGKGKVKGFEIAYQQTYDFLPGFLSGLGASASYTYIESKGLPNSRLNNGAPVTNSPIGLNDRLPLEQLSKHNVNVQVFYEKGPISLRAAYQWRSRFLLTSSDVIFPYYPIFNEPTGQLDASAFFTVTKGVKIGVQAVNLTNEITKTSQMFTLSGLRGPRSYFMNDRRFSFIIRGNL